MILWAWRIFIRYAVGWRPELKPAPPRGCSEYPSLHGDRVPHPLCNLGRCPNCCRLGCKPKCGSAEALTKDEVQMVADYRAATKHIGGAS